MKRLTVLLAVVFSPIALAAQNMGASAGGVFTIGKGSSSESAMLTISPPVAACPVSLRAQHKADGSMVQVGDAHPHGIGQWLRLVLENGQSGQVVKATVTVHGFSNKARMTQATGSNSGSDVVRTLAVTFTAASANSVSGEVWAPAMTAVTRIDLNSVTYADGQVRLFTAQDGCRVAPDPFMLIARR